MMACVYKWRNAWFTTQAVPAPFATTGLYAASPQARGRTAASQTHTIRAFAGFTLPSLTHCAGIHHIRIQYKQ